jgi:biopolymer transport protein ExbB
MRSMQKFRHFCLFPSVLGVATLLFGSTSILAQISPIREAVPLATTILENPYGIEAVWAQGDLVSRGTLIALMVMSMGTWYVGIVKIFEQNRLFKDAREAKMQFWQSPSVDEGKLKLGEHSAFRYMAEESIKAAIHHEGSLTQAIDFPSWVGMSMQRTHDEIAERIGHGLAFLATVGSTAPFVGLFGTVWGIYHALTAIGLSGQASIDKVAGPVGEALIMTAIGLAVAVPAVLLYNWLVRRNKSALAQIRQFSGKLQMALIASSQKAVNHRAEGSH